MITARNLFVDFPREKGKSSTGRCLPTSVFTVCAVILMGAAVFGCRRPTQEETSGGKHGGTASSVPAVRTAKAQAGEIGVFIHALGVVTPQNTVSVKARIDGQILKVHYREGQVVQAGDLLFEIDPAPYQAAVMQAEGQLARDTALLENARLDLDRYKDAYAKSAVSRQQFDTQGASVHQYDGIVKLDQGLLENARVQLAYCRITAPITGRVGLRLVDAGNIVRAADASPLVVITQLRPITVVFNVAEDDLPQIQKALHGGTALPVEALDRTQQKKLAAGTLETLDNVIDATTGTLKLRARFENEDESLFPNQFVNVRLLVETHRDVTLLPNTVIQRSADGAFVYAMKDDQTVSMHPITVTVTDGEVSEVGGLEAGTVVVADNFNRLTDGAKVTLRAATKDGNHGGARTRAQ